MTMMPQPTLGAVENNSEIACMLDGDGYGNATPENDAVGPGTDCDDAEINPAERNCTNPPE